MELADLVVINKADIDPHAATHARVQIQTALRLLGLQGNPQRMTYVAEGAGGAASTLARWQPRVMQLSGLQGQGLDAFWQAVTEFQATQTANGALTERRQQQALAWMWERIDAELKAAFRAHAQVRAALPDITQSVTQGHLPPSTAARRLLALTAEGQA